MALFCEFIRLKGVEMSERVYHVRYWLECSEGWKRVQNKHAATRFPAAVLGFIDSRVPLLTSNTT